MSSKIARGLGLPSLVLAGAVIGSLLTGVAFANQPHMVNALNYLKSAQTQLNAATADKAGHRANAINLVNQAITQTQAGIAAAAN